MSTRSIIFVTNQKESYRLYKHSDGYPTGNLPIIKQAIEEVQQLQPEDDDRFMSRSNDRYAVSCLVGKILGAATSEYGMGAYIEEDYYDGFNSEQLGNQWDLEWIYILDPIMKTLKIYGGGYANCSPQQHLANGYADPVAYADRLIEEYQDRERQEINKLVSEIMALGYQINDNPLQVIPVEPEHLPEPKKALPDPPKQLPVSKPMTFADARLVIMAKLESAGWTINHDGPIPFATTPRTALKVFFKPRTLWRGMHKPDESLWVDMKGLASLDLAEDLTNFLMDKLLQEY